jgi:hypothetical protein
MKEVVMRWICRLDGGNIRSEFDTFVVEMLKKSWQANIKANVKVDVRTGGSGS